MACWRVEVIVDGRRFWPVIAAATELLAAESAERTYRHVDADTRPRHRQLIERRKIEIGRVTFLHDSSLHLANDADPARA